MPFLKIIQHKQPPMLINIALVKKISHGTERVYIDWADGEDSETIVTLPKRVGAAFYVILSGIREQADEVDLTPFQKEGGELNGT